LLQTTKGWYESTLNNVRVVVAGSNNHDDTDNNEESYINKLDDSIEHDEGLMESMFFGGKKTKKKMKKNISRPARPSRHVKDKRISNKINKKHFLPRLGGGGQSVPELDHHEGVHTKKKKNLYMSSSFDMARQPFMKSSPNPSQQVQAWDRVNKWNHDHDMLKKAGHVSKSTLPISKIYNHSNRMKKNSASVFDLNAKRTEKEYRSGKDHAIINYIEHKNKSVNKPYVLPMKIELN
jgi:hypothetical protein